MASGSGSLDGQSRFPTLVSWAESLSDAAKIARYGVIAYEQLALDAPRFWDSLGEEPVRRMSTSGLDRVASESGLPSLGDRPVRSPLRENEAGALEELKVLLDEANLICSVSSPTALAVQLAYPGWLMLDGAAAVTIENGFRANHLDPNADAVRFTEVALAREPAQLAARLASNICYLYLAKTIPRLESQPLEVVLRWRTELSDSLKAYRARVSEIVELSWQDDSEAVDQFIASVSFQLDREFEELRGAVTRRSLYKASLESLPENVGMGTSLSVSFVEGLAHPVVAATIAAGTVGGRIVTAVLKTAKLRSGRRRAPMYWRYAIGSKSR